MAGCQGCLCNSTVERFLHGAAGPTAVWPLTWCYRPFGVAGHGYLAAVLPPPADALREMAEQQAGSSQLLAAGTELAEALLTLVPVLLGAVAHLSPEMPLQQYWGAVSGSIVGSHTVEAVTLKVACLVLARTQCFCQLLAC